MKINHKLIFSLATISVVSIAIVGATTTFAQGNNAKTSFIAELAQKLGIDQSKVQQAVSQIRQEHQANRQTNYQNKLEQDVQNGKITEVQKTAILNEMAQLQAKYSPTSLKNMTPAQRKQTLQQEVSDIQTWAKSQGIDPKYLKIQFIGPRGRWGMKHGGVKSSPTPSPSSAPNA